MYVQVAMAIKAPMAIKAATIKSATIKVTKAIKEVLFYFVSYSSSILKADCRLNKK